MFKYSNKNNNIKSGYYIKSGHRYRLNIHIYYSSIDVESRYSMTIGT